MMHFLFDTYIHFLFLRDQDSTYDVKLLPQSGIAYKSFNSRLA